MGRKENKRRTIIADLNLPKTTTREGRNAYMKEYMRRIRSPSQVLFQKPNPCPTLFKRRRK